MRAIQVGIDGMGESRPRAAQNSESVDFACFVEIDAGIALAQDEAYNFDRSLIFWTLPEARAGDCDWQQSSQSARLRALCICLIGVTHDPKIFVANRAVRAAAFRC